MIDPLVSSSTLNVQASTLGARRKEAIIERSPPAQDQIHTMLQGVPQAVDFEVLRMPF